MANSFKAGDVVQLKSGGPLGTVTSQHNMMNDTYNVIFHNVVTGDFVNITIVGTALRNANEMPENPKSSFGQGGHRG